MKWLSLFFCFRVFAIDIVSENPHPFCQEITLNRPLTVYTIPLEGEESGIQVFEKGKIHIMFLDKKPKELLSWQKNKKKIRVRKVRICDRSHADLLGFVEETEFEESQIEEESLDGGLPPSTLSNPVPHYLK